MLLEKENDIEMNKNKF